MRERERERGRESERERERERERPFKKVAQLHVRPFIDKPPATC